MNEPERVRQKQEHDLVFLELTKHIFESPTKRGCHALGENPARAQSWKQEDIAFLRAKYFEVTGDLCMYGMKDSQGNPLQKPSQL